MSSLTFTQIMRNKVLFQEAQQRNADLARAHKARVYPKPSLDAGDDDYEFVADSLERWADRPVRDPLWAEAKRR